MKAIYPISSLFSIRKLRSLLSFGVKGYLAEIGWLEAYKHRTPIDINGDPIPWFTYSFIDFLQERLTKHQRVFEFGSGNSTRYFAEKCLSIHSVEHHQEWYKLGLDKKPENAELTFIELDQDGKYCRAAKASNHTYDIIIVDGRDRVNCCKQSIEVLTDQGVIILDDSERVKYEEARTLLKSRGFKELLFSGISPGFFYRKATSVFYRQNNCFNI